MGAAAGCLASVRGRPLLAVTLGDALLVLTHRLAVTLLGEGVTGQLCRIGRHAGGQRAAGLIKTSRGRRQHGIGVRLLKLYRELAKTWKRLDG